MADVLIQDAGASRVYRARTTQPIEVDYHDGLGRFGIEAVTDDGRTVVLYLSMIEACGVSAALRTEIASASDAIERRADCGNDYRTIGYNGRRR